MNTDTFGIDPGATNGIFCAVIWRNNGVSDNKNRMVTASINDVLTLALLGLFCIKAPSAVCQVVFCPFGNRRAEILFMNRKPVLPSDMT